MRTRRATSVVCRARSAACGAARLLAYGHPPRHGVNGQALAAHALGGDRWSISTGPSNAARLSTRGRREDPLVEHRAEVVGVGDEGVAIAGVQFVFSSMSGSRSSISLWRAAERVRSALEVQSPPRTTPCLWRCVRGTHGSRPKIAMSTRIITQWTSANARPITSCMSVVCAARRTPAPNVRYSGHRVRSAFGASFPRSQPAADGARLC